MDSEKTLPKATVQKLIKKVLHPPLKQASSEISSVVAELAQEFIHVLSSKAHDQCLAKGKKTINHEHVLTALDAIKFPYDSSQVDQVLSEYTQQQAHKPSQQLKKKYHGKTEQELREEQEKLFADVVIAREIPESQENLHPDIEEYD
mmetsp:Transcript_8651/g.12849  ORF Transcript_8651/g.12849 Transcript_8651/m.12849 type:complete len:147 (-) Transcript_8651:28-468(-)